VHLRADREPAAGEIDGVLAAAGVATVSVRRIVPTLEDVFIERLVAAVPLGEDSASS
jgi:hypothetical protein